MLGQHSALWRSMTKQWWDVVTFSKVKSSRTGQMFSTNKEETMGRSTMIVSWWKLSWPSHHSPSISGVPGAPKSLGGHDKSSHPEKVGTPPSLGKWPHKRPISSHDEWKVPHQWCARGQRHSLQHFGVDWDHPGAVPTGKEEAETTLNASDHGVLPAAPKWLHLTASGRLTFYLPWKRYGESGIQCGSKIPRVLLGGDLQVLYSDIN